MNYLCLAYGSEQDWNALAPNEQEALLAQDEFLRKKGMVIAAVDTQVATVRAWGGTPTTTVGAASGQPLQLAGFYILQAANLDEAAKLVADTPCARARGAVEIRQISSIHGLPDPSADH